MILTPTLEDIRRAVAAMTPAELAEYSAEIAADERDRREHPLAYARFWHNAEPGHTSQLRNARERLTSGALTRWELGGNRSGKSEGGAIEDALYGLGRDHPDVIRCAALNGFDLDLTDIPAGPGTVWVDAPDSNDSIRYVRPKVAAYLPPSTKWRNRHGNGEATATYTDERGTATWVFKSVDQGRDGHQGDKVRRVRFDEEPGDESVVNECLMRVADLGGHLSFTMTPLWGWTKLLSDYIREPDGDTFVRWLHGTDNPHVPRDMLERIYQRYGTHERAARERGDIVALEGRVYVDWRRDLHVVPAFVPPLDWPRYAWVDFGVRNPTAIGWVAWDPADDVLHLYREHYERERTTEWHGHRFQALSEGEAIRWVVADAAATAERMTWATMGIPTYPSPKGAGSVRAGISLCAERLAPDAMGRPHFVVHDSCPEFIREVESYVWDTTRRTGDLADAPLKKQDHHMDGWRYFIAMFGRTDGARAG